jgi:hypothetical protein
MNFKQYIKENKLEGFKKYIDRLSFTKGHASIWLANPKQYGFEMWGGADIELEISYINLTKKFGRPLVKLDKQGEGAIYYWGIEFKDGLKLIITNVFYYDSDNGYIDLPKFEPIFWHFYISPYSETEDNAETVKDKLEDIFLIKL